MKEPEQPARAIALHYDGQQAPTLTAKAEAALAEEILAAARDHDIPIYENADLVRLLARLELGDAIPEPLYQCIAEIIAFAWYLRGKSPDSEPAQTASPHPDRQPPTAPRNPD